MGGMEQDLQTLIAKKHRENQLLINSQLELLYTIEELCDIIEQYEELLEKREGELSKLRDRVAQIENSVFKY